MSKLLISFTALMNLIISLMEITESSAEFLMKMIDLTVLITKRI